MAGEAPAEPVRRRGGLGAETGLLGEIEARTFIPSTRRERAGEDKPAEGEEKPAEGEEKPVEGAEKPAEGQENAEEPKVEPPPADEQKQQP